jgi:hypothetical protein
MRRFRPSAIAAILLAAMVAGCSGGSGGLGESNQVIVRSNDLGTAQGIANQECAARGRGPARFVMDEARSAGSGSGGGVGGGQQNTIFECTPAR